MLDGEAVAHSFDALRTKHGGRAACLFAFDLLQLDGEDLRPLPLVERRARLASLLADGPEAIRFNEHIAGDAETIFRQACAIGFEGIVSKRADAPYCSGRTTSWLKVRNPSYQRA